MPVVSQSIIRPMVPVGASTDGLRVAHAVALAELDGVVPRLLRGAEQLGAARAPRRSWPPRRGACAAR